jgi:hypothetical protein
MPLRFSRATCPKCRLPPVGTVEALSGLAELVQAGEGLFDYGGYTRINWDGQRTISRNGEVLMECAEGHLWWSRRTEIESTPPIPQPQESPR